MKQCVKKSQKGYVGKSGQTYVVHTYFSPGNAVMSKRFSDGHTKLLEQFEAEALKFAKKYTKKEFC